MAPSHRLCMLVPASIYEQRCFVGISGRNEAVGERTAHLGSAAFRAKERVKGVVECKQKSPFVSQDKGLIYKSEKRQGVGNVVLYVTGQSDLNSTKTVQLTNYSANGNTSASVPQLVKLSNDRFLVLWEPSTKNQYGAFETDGTICYAFVDGSGKQIGQAQSEKARLSDCQPITVDGKAVWYVTSNSAPKFYEIDQNGSLTAYSAASSGTQQPGQTAPGTPENPNGTLPG